MKAAELRRLRCAAQGLAGGESANPARAVSGLLAVQAQDLRAARLALRARGAARRAAEVDAALTDARSLVVTWLMRGTLHLVAREDHAWLLALTAAQTAAGIRRRLGELGLDPDGAQRAGDLVERALAADGPLTRARLAERLRAAGVRAEGQTVPYLLASVAARGTIVLGPVQDGGQAFALARDWLGAPGRPPARDVALAELARRYLRGHGPASAADLAAWSGVGLRDARAGLSAIAGELVQDGELLDLAGRAEPPRRLPPRLLGAFDPYLLGWRSRGFAVDPEHAHRVHPGGGILRATAIAGGRAVGTWSRRGERVAIEAFAPLARTVESALGREAARVAAFERVRRR